MMRQLVICFLLLTLFQVIAASGEMPPGITDMVVKTCAYKSRVTEAELDDYTKNSVPFSSNEGGCFIHCLYYMFGFFDNGRVYTKENAMKFFNGAGYNNEELQLAEKVVETCEEELKSADPNKECEYGSKLVQCVKKVIPTDKKLIDY